MWRTMLQTILMYTKSVKTVNTRDAVQTLNAYRNAIHMDIFYFGKINYLPIIDAFTKLRFVSVMLLFIHWTFFTRFSEDSNAFCALIVSHSILFLVCCIYICKLTIWIVVFSSFTKAKIHLQQRIVCYVIKRHGAWVRFPARIRASGEEKNGNRTIRLESSPFADDGHSAKTAPGSSEPPHASGYRLQRSGRNGIRALDPGRRGTFAQLKQVPHETNLTPHINKPFVGEKEERFGSRARIT